jgi:hypothetical protein
MLAEEVPALSEFVQTLSGGELPAGWFKAIDFGCSDHIPEGGFVKRARGTPLYMVSILKMKIVPFTCEVLETCFRILTGSLFKQSGRDLQPTLVYLMCVPVFRRRSAGR